MCKEVNIIIIEDDTDQISMYKDTINSYNAENQDYKIIPHCFKDENGVHEILFNNRIDGMVIDLDWRSSDPTKEGNDLIRRIYSDCRVPIFVVSGNLNLLHDDYTTSPLFKKYLRDDCNFFEILEEIVELYKSGYTETFGNLSKINKILSKVFWGHMNEMIFTWKDLDEDIKSQRILRYASTIINQLLLINDNSSYDNHYAVEFYIKPAISKELAPGDIIYSDDRYCIVLSTACDLVQNKADFILIAYIDLKKFTDLIIKIKSDEKKHKNELVAYINNAKNRYHLLPPCEHFDGGLIDFQDILSITKEKFIDIEQRVFSVNPVFYKDIQARFASYYARQGQPQLDFENILDYIKKH